MKIYVYSQDKKWGWMIVDEKNYPIWGGQSVWETMLLAAKDGYEAFKNKLNEDERLE